MLRLCRTERHGYHRVMDHVATDEVIRIARELFAEAYKGPKAEWTWFANAEPDSGVLGSIQGLTAEQASRAVTPGSPTIAAHVEHLRWSLAAVNRTIRGEPWNPDWSESWAVRTVDEAQWRELQANLRQEVDTLIAALDAGPPVTDPNMLQGLFALAPHAAHHLGAIRQMARLVNAE